MRNTPLPPSKVGNFTAGMHWQIQGGARNTRPLSRANFFHFRAVFGKNLTKQDQKRMHSSRMPTVRCSGRLGGVSVWGCLPTEVSAQEVVVVCVCLGGVHLPPLWTEFLTHACENITFPQLLLRTVIIGFGPQAQGLAPPEKT